MKIKPKQHKKHEKSLYWLRNEIAKRNGKRGEELGKMEKEPSQADIVS
tara:strand:+ start:4518 stop:4661 length:144 start_codon:yes stop_codon:yes gene_type:complete